VNKPGSRPPQALTLTALACALMLTLSARHAAAQTEPAKPGAGLERAQKAADAVFHWIKLNGEKGASRQNPPPAPPPPPAPAARKAVAAAPRPAPTPAAQPAQPPAPAALAATAPAPAPEPVVVAAQPEPEPERAPVLLAAAAPTPAPAAPMAAAARAVEPPPPPAEVPLKLLVKVEPVIPRQLAQQNFRNGFAQVQFTVAPDGSVSKAQVIKASHNRLGTAAIDAVKQWRFAPLPQARDAAVEVAFSNVDE
jgi:TonB family protein